MSLKIADQAQQAKAALQAKLANAGADVRDAVNAKFDEMANNKNARVAREQLAVKAGVVGLVLGILLTLGAQAIF